MIIIMLLTNKGNLCQGKTMLKKLTICFFIITNFILSCSGKTDKKRTLTEEPLINSRPNIIFILTDDQALIEISHMKHTKTLLANEGLTFKNHFVTDSLCCPSRTSILTGQYVHNHGVKSNGGKIGGFYTFRKRKLEKETIGYYLKKSGYRTVLLGRVMNGYNSHNTKYFLPGWDEWYSFSPKYYKGKPRHDGKYFNYALNQNGKLIKYGSKPKDYQTDVFSRLTVDFIHRQNTKKQPFFIYLAPYAPHLPMTSADRHKNMLNKIKVPRTPSFNEKDISDKPAWVQGQPIMSKVKIKRLDKKYQGATRMLLAVDEMVLKIVNKLREKGILENTYIIFTSDNGRRWGAHRFPGGKLSAYEEDIRVPFFMRGPGLKKGQIIDELTLNIDFFPTFMQLAKAPIPVKVDGRSLVPIVHKVNNKPLNWRNSFLIEHWPPPNRQYWKKKKIPPHYFGIRTKNYKYVEYESKEKLSNLNRELYDLKKDPYEMNNIYNIANKQLVKQLKSQLNLLKVCKGKGCKNAENKRIP